MNLEEKTIKSEEVYKGEYINVSRVTVELPNGKEAGRDIVYHPGACLVIPMCDNGDVYIVRQYRKTVEKVLTELPAGKLDKGEDPLACARRELKEETGLDAKEFKFVISTHMAPGFTDEIIHIYYATGLEEGHASTDEDEFIALDKIHITELVNMVINNEITDAKSIIGIYMAEKIFKGEIKI